MSTTNTIDSHIVSPERTGLDADIIRRAGARWVFPDRVILTPSNTELKRVDDSLPHPFRDAKRVRLLTLDALVEFVKSEQARSGNPAEWFISEKAAEAVLNYVEGGKPGWADSVAKFILSRSTNWKNWTQCDNTTMNQEQFCDFLEDNLCDICEPAGADVLQMVSNFRMNTQVTYQSSYRTADGQIKMIYDEEKTGNKREMAIPSVVTLQLPVIDGAEAQTTYKVTARLYSRINRHDHSLCFAYKLVRPDLAEKNALHDVAEYLRGVIAPTDGLHEGVLNKTPNEVLQMAFDGENA